MHGIALDETSCIGGKGNTGFQCRYRGLTRSLWDSFDGNFKVWPWSSCGDARSLSRCSECRYSERRRCSEREESRNKASLCDSRAVVRIVCASGRQKRARGCSYTPFFIVGITLFFSRGIRVQQTSSGNCVCAVLRIRSFCAQQ